MKVIFVNWTKPFFYKHQAEGYNKDKLGDITSVEYDMVDYELLINKAAVISAKRHLKVPVKLYTDDVGYEFYKKHNMLSIFDEIDVDTLNTYNTSTYNSGKWWTSGKSVAIGTEEPPFLFLDNDFILKGPLDEDMYNYDLVHTHWEIQRGKWFVSEDMVKKYEVPIDNFVQDMMMPNTSFVFMNNKTLRDCYVTDHLNIVRKDYDSIPEWLWLMSDQGIMGYCARELELNVASIEPSAYIAFTEEMKWMEEEFIGHSPTWVKVRGLKHIKKPDYWHVWTEKVALREDEEFRQRVIAEMNAIIKPDIL